MRAAFLTLIALFAAGQARAWDLPPEALRDLARGLAWLEVRPDGPGASGRIRAAEDVAAPPERVFAPA